MSGLLQSLAKPPPTNQIERLANTWRACLIKLLAAWVAMGFRRPQIAW
jgi:hypothetical protein